MDLTLQIMEPERSQKADVICDATGSTEAEACPEGYVCEESSNSEESIHFPCREVCHRISTCTIMYQNVRT